MEKSTLAKLKRPLKSQERIFSVKRFLRHNSLCLPPSSCTYCQTIPVFNGVALGRQSNLFVPQNLYLHSVHSLEHILCARHCPWLEDLEVNERQDPVLKDPIR